jgi:hypothetical protein
MPAKLQILVLEDNILMQALIQRSIKPGILANGIASKTRGHFWLA